MKRVFVTASSLADEALSLLAERGCTCVFGCDNDSAEETARKLGECNPAGLIVRRGRVSAAAIASASALQAISKHGVGVDTIDIAAATARGIPVMVTALANYESVAEHALALILAVSRRIPAQDRKVRQGIWDRQDFGGDDLRGKTIGIVGFGRIGRRLAELVRPLNMTVLTFDPNPGTGASAAHPVSLHELLSRADIVSIHCPLNSTTRGLIGRTELALLKPGAIVVNTARGGIIDEPALIEALRERRICAALDTLTMEPPPADHPLFAMDNVVLTAHIGGFSGNSYRNMGVGAVENILAVLDGRRPDPRCVMNPEVFSGPLRALATR